MAGLSGVLCSALVLPVVASTGILVRNTANKVTATALNVATLPQRSAMYDRSGHLITYVYGVNQGTGATYEGVDRQPVAYGQVSPEMLKAIVAIEDDRYWQHAAIDFQGTLRAVVNDAEGNAVQGGSTIVQQYVKGVLVLEGLGNPAAEKAATAGNVSRKYDELRMALDVAHHLSKQDILAGYLNDSYFEQAAWGVEAAAETYFGTTAAKLTLTQAATLAGMVENPSAYDPLLHPQAAVMAIAEDRPYGTKSGQTEVDYAVNTQYGGQNGVQTRSSSKLFTLVTALQQGMPFGYTATVPYAGTFNGYADCSGAPAGYNPANGKDGSWSVVNSSSGDHGMYSLYTGMTDSINTFFAELELKVGLCNVVHTAADLGITRADGTSLLAATGCCPPTWPMP
jgi:membrane peptidoglycan carboxypeptidase